MSAVVAQYRSSENSGSGGHLLGSDRDLEAESTQLLDSSLHRMASAALIDMCGVDVAIDITLFDQVVSDDEDSMTNGDGGLLGTSDSAAKSVDELVVWGVGSRNGLCNLLD